MMKGGLRHITYRGALKSCNYSCSYCPFAKRPESEAELERDREALLRFVSYLEGSQWDCRNENSDAPDVLDTEAGSAERSASGRLSVLIAPYGEAMGHRWYWEALARLSRSRTVGMVSCQTNLSFDADQFLDRLAAEMAVESHIALWATFHPEMASAEDFAEKVLVLSKRIRLCVGVVGNPENRTEIAKLKGMLPPSASFWINQMDGLKRPYTREEATCFTELDPLFPLEQKRYPADASRCGGGRDSLFVEWDGSASHCNRSRVRLGNLYDEIWDGTSAETEGLELSDVVPPCRGRCDCYLSYSNRKDLPGLLKMAPHPQLRIARPQSGLQGILLDVDGTLTGRNGRIRESAAEAVLLLAERFQIYLATALTAEEAMRKCGTARSAISGGVFAYGADIWDMKSGWRETAFLEDPVEDDRMVSLGGRVYSLDGRPYKVAVPVKAMTGQQSVEGTRLQSLFPNSRLIREGRVLSIVKKGVTKLSGTQRLFGHVCFDPETVLVMGDGAEDAELLSALLVSAAPPSASEHAKEAARFLMTLEEMPSFL